MPKFNLNNMGSLDGNLVRDPVIFKNSDNSSTVYLTLACNRAYKNADGTRPADFIDCEAFVPASSPGLGPFEFLHKGDHVGLGFQIQSSSYVDKAGDKIYKQAVVITDVAFRDKKKSA